MCSHFPIEPTKFETSPPLRATMSNLDDFVEIPLPRGSIEGRIEKVVEQAIEKGFEGTKLTRALRHTIETVVEDAIERAFEKRALEHERHTTEGRMPSEQDPRYSGSSSQGPEPYPIHTREDLHQPRLRRVPPQEVPAHQ